MYSLSFSEDSVREALLWVLAAVGLMASSTALKDIQRGRGELVYYPKSHLFLNSSSTVITNGAQNF